MTSTHSNDVSFDTKNGRQTAAALEHKSCRRSKPCPPERQHVYFRRVPPIPPASTIHALEVSNCKQAAAAGEGEQEAKGDDTHQQGTFFFVAGGGGGVSIPPRGEEWRRCTKHRSPSTSIPSSPPRRRVIRHREAEVERREAEVAAERTRGGGVDATTSRRKR